MVLLTLIVLPLISPFFLKGPAPGIMGPCGIKQKQQQVVPDGAKSLEMTPPRYRDWQAAERKYDLATRDVERKK